MESNIFRILSWAVVWAVGCIILVGCSSPEKVPAPETKAIPSQSIQLDVAKQMGEPENTLPAIKKFTLLEKGRSPRAVRQYTLSQNEQTLSHTLAATVRSLDGGVWSDPQQLPPVDFAISYGQQSLARENKEASRTLTWRGNPLVLPDTVTKKQRAAMEQLLFRFKRFVSPHTGIFTLSDRGLLSDAVVTSSHKKDQRKNITDEVYLLLLQAMVPFPKQRIGKGAKWKVTTLLNRNQAVVQQVAEYTLTDIKKGVLHIAIQLRQTGERQYIPVNGNQHVELIGFVYEAKGSFVIDVAKATPVTGKLSLEVRNHLRAPDAKQGSFKDIASEATAELAIDTRQVIADSASVAPSPDKAPSNRTGVANSVTPDQASTP